MIKRDAKGLWVKGQSGNPKGRPPRPVELNYLRIIRDACSLDDWKKIVITAVKNALGGDRHARDWLSKYLVGSDAHAVNLIDLAAVELTGHSPVAERIAEYRGNAICESDLSVLQDEAIEEYGLQAGIDAHEEERHDQAG